MNHCFENYQDIYKGKRAWIIGNGPSLNQIDLSLLDNEISFAMNRISLLYNRTSWRPTYYMYCSDNVNNSVWGKELTKDIKNAVEQKATTAFIWNRFKHVIIQGGKLAKNPNWFDDMTEYGPDDERSFSIDAVDRLDKSGTSMNVVFQLAYFMGIKEIFLLGADLGWKTTSRNKQTDPNHFDSSYNAHIGNGDWENAHMRRTHQLVKKHLDKLGVKVYNASKKTLLDVYPLVNYEDILEGKIDTNARLDEQKEIEEYWKTNNYQGIKGESR